MKGYIAFTKKELVENIMNFRLFILFAVFLVFGVLSPIFAKYTPELLAALAPNMEGLHTEPAVLDSWKQFYKNISGVGFSAFIILFGNCFANEYAKGTLVLMVTKGLPRWAVVLSKFTAAAILMTVCYWASFLAAYRGAVCLWERDDTALRHTVFAAFSLWVIGFLYLSILMLGCVLFRQAFTSILFAGGVIAGFSLLGIAKQTARLNPLILASKNVDLISGAAAAADFFVPIVISLGGTAVFLAAAMRCFDKKQL